MPIWISKVSAYWGALIALSALAACDIVPVIIPTASRDLTSATIAWGKAVVVAPDGFCIDRRSLRTHFVLLARCSRLDNSDKEAPSEAPSSGRIAPPVILTVALAPWSTDAPTQAPDTDDLVAVQQERILRETRRDGLTLVALEGEAPHADLSQLYWRGIGMLDADTAMAVAIYVAETQSRVPPEAQKLLAELFRRSSAATRALAEGGNRTGNTQ